MLPNSMQLCLNVVSGHLDGSPDGVVTVTRLTS